MLPQSFDEFFKKIHLQRKMQNSHKIKQCNKHNRKIRYESLSSKV